NILEQARELRPDVLLISLHRSTLDVLRVVSRIHSELASLNILILADTETADQAFQAIRAGACGFVLQDTDVEELVTALCMVARGQAVLPSTILASVLDTTANGRPVRRRPSRIERLTSRESEVLDLIVQGVSNREIAALIFVSESTVRSHI